MDHQYIEELRQLDDKKEAKAKLIEYAEQFGLQLKKSKGFDNLVIDIEAGLKELAAEPIEQVEGGLSISDLIDADDEISGAKAHIEGETEAKEEAVLLFDAPMTHAVEHIQVTEAPVKIPEVELREPEIIPTKAEVVYEEPVINAPTIPENKEETSEEKFELPADFSPHLILMGKNPGYVTLPWWIYQWIKETPDWKSRPTSFPHPSAHQTLFSLLYYIYRNGSILVRETRNSSFVTLK
ncbi:minor head protein inhibitor of protease [Enterobacter phage vB_EclM_Q7622]|uniref:minor head protein inhibitor of protease n=1 Tax=Enterobacter phage vB_EclM_Q7622 TaxID=2908628 RepID=UPI0023295F26|nr:minor head protein inhibitor of protease [Enterobacter phage vB_EclM_Q7622]UIS65718.1 inhibitor of prohead protease [Enterobacter phage vB_EclM_Q7622]